MKKILLFVILWGCLSNINTVYAADTSALREAVPFDAREYISITPESGDVNKGIKHIIGSLLTLIRSGLRKSFSEGFVILSVSSLAGIVSLFSSSLSSDILRRVTDVTAICVTASLCLSGASGVLESCGNSVRNLQYFSSALIPVYAAAVAVSGSPLAAVSTSSAALIFSNVLIFAASKILIPMIYLHITLSAAGRIAENDIILGSAKLFRKASLTFFKYFLMLYTGYITLSGLISSGTDVMTLKTAKMTISGSVPVLGSIVSDVTEALLGGAVILKNAIGIYGFIGALAICLVPFASAFARLLVFKLLSLLSSSLCKGEISKLLDDISESYGIALGLLGACCAMEFLSFVICSVVIKT